MTGPELTERYRSARRDPTVAVLEGLHSLKHALRFGAEILDARAPDASAVRLLAADLAPDVVGALEGVLKAVDRDRFETLAPSPHPTGVIALARRPSLAPGDILDSTSAAPLVLLERPTHHGNTGAVIRVAAAADAAGVLVTGPHDPWHPSSIRGAAGLQFALPVARVPRDGLGVVLASDRPVVALDPAGEPLREPMPARAIVVFGSERAGVSEALLDRADAHVRIPMRPGVSSLNLATAVAAALYAAGGFDAS